MAIWGMVNSIHLARFVRRLIFLGIPISMRTLKSLFMGPGVGLFQPPNSDGIYGYLGLYQLWRSD